MRILPAAAKSVGHAPQGVLREAEAIQNFADAGFHGFGALHFQIGLRLRELAQSVARFVVFGGFEFFGQRHDAVLGFVGFGESRLHLFAHRDAQAALRFLREHADGFVVVQADVALIGFFVAHDHLEEGGFAGSVGADQTDAVVGADKRSAWS